MSVIVKCKKPRTTSINQSKNKQLVCDCSNKVTYYCTTPSSSCLPCQSGQFTTYSTALLPCTMIQGSVAWNGVKKISCITFPCSPSDCCPQINCEPY